jgi:exportin-1
MTLDCLTEIAALPPSDIPNSYSSTLQLMLVRLMNELRVIVPLHTNLAIAYENGSDDDRLFVARLALFLGTFLKSHLHVLEGSSERELQVCCVDSLTYLIMVSEVDDEEIFKTCLEFWYTFTKELYTTEDARIRSQSAIGGMILGSGPLYGSSQSSRTSNYAALLHRLRNVMIDKMAKPEEVIIVEDENGDIVREMTKDTEVIAQYKTMREAIIYLTHLGYEDTESIMLSKLELQVDGGMFSWQGLNTLCWAIGSISGAMSENDEKRFLVTVIKDLLRLCEDQRGKDNKAVVASNIMYVVGQYPRFLRAHWKFLKTVVNKLFEFMHEHHPGVQDMACDTFLKIAQKCKRKFMTIQQDEPQPFILTLISDLHRHINDLQPHQVQAFYEAVSCMLSDRGPGIQGLEREQVMLKLMELPNASWSQIIAQGSQNVGSLFELDVVKELSKILRTNTKVCGAAGSIYIHQLSVIFLDMLNIYRLYSQHISDACAKQGEVVTRYTLFKAMRGVKSEILDLMTQFIESSKDLENSGHILMTTFMPALMFEVLADYKQSVASARDARVLILFATTVSVLRQIMSSEIPNIMNAVFEPTLEMITKNMMDFPDHRIGFFKFLREVNEHCFFGLFSIPPPQQKLVIDSIVWAFKHTERNISETGLEILLELIQNVGKTPELAQPFYQQYLLSLTHDVLGIMTDRLHKSGFKLQGTVLQHVFSLLQNGCVVAAVYDPTANTHAPLSPDGSADNKNFVKEYIANMLILSFPNLTKNQVVHFVNGLFEISRDLIPFKQHLRDFLVAIKEFEVEDNTELFIEEFEANAETARQKQWEYRASVPGLLSPQELFDTDI